MPASKRLTGGWKTAIFLLVNQAFAALAFFGLAVNMVLFLRRVLQQGNADAANTVSKWTGAVYMFSLVGAFLSDSYWGRYLTCLIFQMIFVLGLVLLTVSSWLFLLKPVGCGDGKFECMPLSTMGMALFYLSIYLIAIGNGGYQPNLATFGADQFDETDPNERQSKVAFFSYFYVALNLGSLISNTVLVYFEDSGDWSIGFLTAAGSAAAALLLFWARSPGYRHFQPSGNPLTRVAQVFVASARKWSVVVPKQSQELYELEGKESAIAGSRKILHSDKFEFLDKAATITYQDIFPENQVKDPWRLCTVTQVEEAKCVMKMLPIWLCTIIYSVVFTQMASVFVEQGATMNTNFYGFQVPPASMSAFDILSVAFFVFFYQRLLVPLTARLLGNAKGLTELQRMGTGLVICILAMVAAGVVELERLKRVTASNEASSLSILWQIPQYVLIGVSEVFMYVGQLEFFNGQAPDGIKSFGGSLCMASMSLGNFVSSILVTIVMKITTRDGNVGWIPENLNSGHLDRWFFFLGALTAVDFLAYLVCAKWYRYIEVDDSGNKDEMEMIVRVL
ncbi:protein NRT1/ PTR FAMILY 7.1-like [Aristolochia californica]|uniref:protein NRT1/ PTR FAMILY 7.1-like n=1 Tax=Aristolochia californica TaxID=171875 RepID=UPI0035DF116D